MPVCRLGTNWRIGGGFTPDRAQAEALRCIAARLLKPPVIEHIRFTGAVLEIELAIIGAVEGVRHQSFGLLAIETGTFFDEPALIDFIATMKDSGGTAHLMGVISDGGVHGHINHVLAAAQALSRAGITVAVHAITDGRDVAPKSAQDFIGQLVERLPERAYVATVIGRYYAMDRDKRWERVKLAYDALVHGIGEQSND